MSLMQFADRAKELRQAYRGQRGMMAAKDIAREEACSDVTAQRLMNSGKLGEVYVRNSRVKRIHVEAYIRYIERQTIIMKSSA